MAQRKVWFVTFRGAPLGMGWVNNSKINPGKLAEERARATAAKLAEDAEGGPAGKAGDWDAVCFVCNLSPGETATPSTIVRERV